MANFDFVTDEDLRQSLETDARELHLCFEADAWKAVHVLAGSVIEAILIDYLVSAQKLEAGAANSKDLGKLIELCKIHNILSPKAIELLTVVRSYRNLIHPGRLIRLAESVDEHGASIAKAVVEIVVEEVAKKKRQLYGFTAEQVVRKIQYDSSAITIAEHLLQDTGPTELRRLLMSVLPAAYLDWCKDDTEESWLVARNLQKLFRLGIKSATPALRKEVAAKYVTVLKEQPEEVVRSYEIGLFRATDLEGISEKDRPVVISHLLATIKRKLDRDVVEAAEGITAYLHGESLEEFLKVLVLSIARDKPKDIRSHPASDLFYGEVWKADPPYSEEIRPALEKLRGSFYYNESVKSVLSTFEEILDVPF